ncbi:MAG: hypothetical protein G01um101448_971 [Parcubacteria group bacterium Gr01-1014_48]|nr:MAG: hypothetical protein Greene041614_628 [Parcubacteria group bacterium Greene0416_14]TSC72521.1 MAG: hypothetical protein G01um101448_971 [Parcubacteria group bacterium Gr01-1014_48]TSD00876.1 MAG: hypothetical protein Greene101415_677 [Parcubacteria group bacterium Greene1014_15]TSD07958.1 MAG: hypothetical protein Greene07144_588 [Parcubacteria group bacterium Greene0714_4]
MRGSAFFVAFAGFMGGTAFRSFFDFGFAGGFLILVLAFSSALFLSREKALLVAIPLFLFAAGIGVLRFDVLDMFGERGEEQLSAGEITDRRALIVDEPIEKENSLRLTVRLEDEKGKLLRPKVLLSTDLFPRYEYGDELLLSGKLNYPENFMTNSGREFNYRAYLRKDGIYFTSAFPRIEIVGYGHGNPVKTFLYFVKGRFLANVHRLMPAPHAALMGGLILGTDEAFPRDLEEDFRRVGLIHIIVLSGYNIAIVAEAVMRLFAFASRRIALFAGGGAIILFAMMTGGHAAVVRASIMALFVLLARVTGRRYDIVRALLLAAGAMVFVNPRILVFDTSFQLSFLATLSLIIVAPIFEKVFCFVPKALSMRENVTATISTQLFVLPVLVYIMGEFSLISVVVNVLVLPVIPISMFFGFLTAATAFVSSALALPFAWAGTALLSYILFFVHHFSRTPFAVFSTPLFPVWGVAVLYGVYAFLIVRFQKETPHSH